MADPRNLKVKEKLNEKVKRREWFRPYAPSISEEFVSEYFKMDYKSPFMLLAPKIKEEKRSLIPAVVHVDDTSRVQTVNKKSLPRFYKLIREFHKITGIPMVLNTSFNVSGKPIVESPHDALECFMGTGMDFLVMDDFLVSKER